MTEKELDQINKNFDEMLVQLNEIKAILMEINNNLYKIKY
jgi:hypothetical protein